MNDPKLLIGERIGSCPPDCGHSSPGALRTDDRGESPRPYVGLMYIRPFLTKGHGFREHKTFSPLRWIVTGGATRFGIKAYLDKESAEILRNADTIGGVAEILIVKVFRNSILVRVTKWVPTTACLEAQATAILEQALEKSRIPEAEKTYYPYPLSAADKERKDDGPG